MQYLVLFLLVFLGSPTIEAKNLSCLPDHSGWTSLLEKHVRADGRVNYAAFKKDLKRVDDYLNHLFEVEEKCGDSWSREEKLAYYINLYNAATIQLVLENYPLESILDIEKPFEKEFIKVGKKEISLTYLENEILRKMAEPRIHFAINCASYSCPKLLNEAFVTANLEEQLDKVTRDFINDPAMNKISGNSLKLSHIFKWYREDFTEKGSLHNYVDSFSKETLSGNETIEFLEYNWALNDYR